MTETKPSETTIGWASATQAALGTRKLHIPISETAPCSKADLWLRCLDLALKYDLRRNSTRSEAGTLPEFINTANEIFINALKIGESETNQ